MNRRKAIAAVLLGIGTTASTRTPTGGSAGERGPVRIFADEAWYRERAEPEQAWEGTLRRRVADTGPGARLGLTFSLQTADQGLPIYAAGVDFRLAPFVGTRVAITGKLVNLGGEGFGRELWIGTIT
jgi:hypothetical protein